MGLNVIITTFKILAILIWIYVLIAMTLKAFFAIKEGVRGSKFMIDYKKGGFEDYLELWFYRILFILYAFFLLVVTYMSYLFITNVMF